MPKDGGQITHTAITLVNQAVWLLELCLGRQVFKSRDCCSGSSLEHLQLIKLFLELSSQGSWSGCTSFKEKVKLSP